VPLTYIEVNRAFMKPGCLFSFLFNILVNLTSLPNRLFRIDSKLAPLVSSHSTSRDESSSVSSSHSFDNFKIVNIDHVLKVLSVLISALTKDNLVQLFLSAAQLSGSVTIGNSMKKDSGGFFY